MTDFTGQYAKARQRERELLAQQGYEALQCVLRKFPEAWRDPRVLELCTRHREAIITYLQTEEGLSRSVFFIVNQLQQAISSQDDFRDPTIASNCACLIGLFLIALVPAFAEPDRATLTEALDVSLVKIVHDQVESFGDQVDALATSIQRVLQFVERLHLGDTPIVLLELPIGNSLPVKLLCRFLEDCGHQTATILASLSRNDSKKRGATRAQILQERLSTFDFSRGGLVLYVDEWESGSNFYNLCPLIAEVLPPGTFPLPMALLTAESKSKDRFQTYIDQHDTYCKALGESGEHWRIVIPPLVARFGRQTYFFWSEHDRSAGYRKMQFLGSFVSTVKAGVDELLGDRDLLLTVKHLVLGDIAEELQQDGSDHVISAGVVGCVDEFVELFGESAAEFAKLLPELEQLEFSINGGTIDDADAVMMSVMDAVGEKIVNSRAKVCIQCSIRLSEMRDRINPENRYHYRKYAPTIVELQGAARRYHDVLFNELYHRIQQLVS